jgi:hypothetical protein
VTIRLRVSPRSATVTVDERPVSGRRIELERSTRAVPVRVKAAGYLPEMVLVVPDRDQEVSIQLDKAEPAEPPVSNAPAGEPKEPADPRPPSDDGADRAPPEEAAPGEGDER